MQPTYDRPAARNQRRETVVQAVRRKCIDCSAGQPSEVRKCPVVACPLWPFRFGTNPFSRPRGSPFPTRSVSQKISPQTAEVSDGNGPPAEMEGRATTGDRASPGKDNPVERALVHALREASFAAELVEIAMATQKPAINHSDEFA